MACPLSITLPKLNKSYRLLMSSMEAQSFMMKTKNTTQKPILRKTKKPGSSAKALKRLRDLVQVDLKLARSRISLVTKLNKLLIIQSQRKTLSSTLLLRLIDLSNWVKLSKTMTVAIAIQAMMTMIIMKDK